MLPQHVRVPKVVVSSLNMNSLSINETLSHGADCGDPQDPQDSPDVAHALTIMNAVSSPVNSDTLERSVSNLPAGHIIRALSTSSSIPSSPLTNTTHRMSSGNTGRVIRIRHKTSKPSKSWKKSSNLWFNRRSKEGQEDEKFNYRLICCLLVEVVMVERETTTRGALRREIAAR